MDAHRPQADDLLHGEYSIVAPLGAGASGTVYEARSRDGERVALKQLADPGQLARFEIEARLLGRLDHPRIAHVRDAFADGDDQYIVMDLVEGDDLESRLQRGGDPGLPIDEAITAVVEACEALEYVHAQNIVHRDVKPANLIVGPDGVVLVDFGIARELESDRTATRAVGTPRYMAPEIAGGEPPSPRSDVYGLAATAWALLTGRPPAYQDSARLSDAVPSLAPAVEEVLGQALELRPERRLASAAALARGLGSPVREAGRSLAVVMEAAPAPANLLEAVVRTAAGVFEAAAASLALVDERTDELVFHAAWGAGAAEIVGVRLPPGAGIAGAARASAEGIAIPACREDPRFEAEIARATRYVPHTMLAVPLATNGRALGVLSVLDRRDGEPYTPADLPRANLFADLARAALAQGG